MRTLVLVFLAGISCLSAFGQQRSFQEGYYVIVGAFAVKENAARFNQTLRRQQIKSDYAYLSSGNLYYVYTLVDRDVDVCLAMAAELRKDKQFYDAWVRYINEDAPDGPENRGEDLATNPAQPEAPAVAAPPIAAQPDGPAEGDIVITDNEDIVQYDQVTLGNTEVFLSLYNARNDKVVKGTVQVIDADRARMIQEVKGNDYLILPNPKSNSGKLTLVCDVVGYRKIQKDIDFNNPLADTSVVEHMGTTLVVNFDLVRYQKGDIRTLFNIYFFNDAAVMMPESKFELGGLVDMMQENPSYKIRLHGHTNGNYHGKIIKRNPDGDFFSVRQDAVTTMGSAKELSESRAGVIRDYLISQGIDGSRIDIKAWGGKRPIFDKHGANAKKNIRVEVEVL